MNTHYMPSAALGLHREEGQPVATLPTGSLIKLQTPKACKLQGQGCQVEGPEGTGWSTQAVSESRAPGALAVVQQADTQWRPESVPRKCDSGCSEEEDARNGSWLR